MINVDSIAKQYALPTAIAREIVAEETSRVLRSKWQLWAILGVAISIFLHACFVLDTDSSRTVAFIAMTGSLLAWHALGKHYAASAIHSAAKAKSDKLQGLHS